MSLVELYLDTGKGWFASPCATLSCSPFFLTSSFSLRSVSYYISRLNHDDYDGSPMAVMVRYSIQELKIILQSPQSGVT